MESAHLGIDPVKVHGMVMQQGDQDGGGVFPAEGKQTFSMDQYCDCVIFPVPSAPIGGIQQNPTG
jgi:hypothetical protein